MQQSEKRVLEVLKQRFSVAVVSVRSEAYQPRTLFVLPGADSLDVALALRTDSYLTHATAVYLHGLNDEIPRTVYANKEQAPKSAPRRALTQESLNRAFAARQRTSEYIFTYGNHRIVLVAGKATWNFGVTRIRHAGIELPVSDIPRTLIDIVVRPAYGGGVHAILEAFRGAIGRVTGAQMVEYLKYLDYVYPYHQAIGYLLERSGHPEEVWSPLYDLGGNFDFFLAHALKRTRYNSKWRLFVPENL